VPDKLEKTKKAGMQKSNARNDQSKKQKKRGTEEAILNEVSGKDKHDEQFKRPLSCKKEQKLIVQVTENAEKQVVMQRQKHKKVSEGIRSQYVHDEREKNVPEKIKFQEKCKKMAYENLEVIRRQEYVKDALEEKKFYKEMSKQEFAQKLPDKQEREKKVEMKKSLTDAWDGQVEYKRQKKMEMDKIKKQGSYSLMESEQLHRTEEVEKKKQKLSTQDKTEQNMRERYIDTLLQKHKKVSEGIRSQYVHDEKKKNVPEMVKFQEKCKKMAYENLEVIRRQEYVKDALEEKKFYKEMTKQEFAQKLLDKQEREKKVMESEQLHRTEEVKRKQKKQKLSTQDKTEQNMKDQERRFQLRAKQQLGQKLREDQEREKLDEQIQYKQQKKKEIVEIERQQMDCNKLLKEKRHRESAEQKREKLEKDSQIQRKRQEKKELSHHQEKKTPKQKPLADELADKLLKEKRHWESAEQKREKLEKEKKIRFKRQEKKE
uniref:Uncharacterized protein n=1 Tax=Poecilia formosa TaxID=48698 RepID=A0A096LQL0_POEFO